jgi:hypothetical protein
MTHRTFRTSPVAAHVYRVPVVRELPPRVSSAGTQTW